MDRTRPKAVGLHEPASDPRAPRGGQLAELTRRRRFLHHFPHRPTLPLTRACKLRIHRDRRIDEDGTRVRMSLGDVARLARDRAAEAARQSLDSCWVQRRARRART